MAAQPWTVFNAAKKNLGLGVVNLSGEASKHYVTLFRQSMSTLYDTTVSTLASLGAFTCAGSLDSKASLAGVTWTGVASMNDPTKRWDANDVTFTASGATLSAVRYAVIWQSVDGGAGDRIIAYSSLSSSQFDVTTGNTLTIQMNASGIFTLA
jgi:hypothetical protein